MKSFLLSEENFKLFQDAVCYPTNFSKKNLDEAFKKHYYLIRLKSYISSTIHFTAINFDKLNRKYRDRNQLMLNKEVSADTETTTIDIIPDQNFYQEPEQASCDRHYDLEISISNYQLYESIKTLTYQQKEVLRLAYGHGCSDTEIASFQNKSQQSISKVHKKALENLKKEITK